MLIVQFNVHQEESCSTEAFHDLPNEFYVDEHFWTTRSRAVIYDNNKNEIGSYTKRPGWTSQFRYRDKYDNVVAMVDRQAFTWTDQYEITRCRKGDGPQYYLDQHFFTIGEIKYDLTKDGVKVAEPIEPTWFRCKPDVAIATVDTGEVIATLSRGCGESFFTDMWHVKNVNPDLVENYVVGFIAYITTQKENEQSQKSSSSSSSSSSKKRAIENPFAVAIYDP